MRLECGSLKIVGINSSAANKPRIKKLKKKKTALTHKRGARAKVRESERLWSGFLGFQDLNNYIKKTTIQNPLLNILLTKHWEPECSSDLCLQKYNIQHNGERDISVKFSPHKSFSALSSFISLAMAWKMIVSQLRLYYKEQHCLVLGVITDCVWLCQRWSQ